MRELLFALLLAIWALVGIELLRGQFELTIDDSTLWVVFSISLIAIALNRIGYRIPLKCIQQTKYPDKWVGGLIENIDNSQNLIYNKDFAEVDLELKSDLNFDIELRSLRGSAIVNGKATNSTLQEQTNINIPKHDNYKIGKWCLYGWIDCIKDSSGILEDKTTTIRLKLTGEDTKNRKYEIITEDIPMRL